MVEFQVEFLKTLEDGVRLVPDLEKLEKVDQFKVSVILKPLNAAPLCGCWAILWAGMNLCCCSAGGVLSCGRLWSSSSESCIDFPGGMFLRGVGVGRDPGIFLSPMLMFSCMSQ